MKRFLIVIPAVLLIFSACGGKKQYFSNISTGETFLSVIGFDDGSRKNFTVVTDVLYAGSDPSSRYKMVFYLPDGWDDSYPLFLDRSVPVEGERAAWTAYQGAPAAEAALKEGNMIVVLVAYDERTAIQDILLAREFLVANDSDLPGNSRNILTSAYFEFE